MCEANRSASEIAQQDVDVQLELQSVSESYNKLQHTSNQTASSSYATCDEGPSWNLKKAIGQVVNTVVLPVEETRYHSTTDETSCSSSEEVVSCDPNTKQHLCGLITHNEMHFSVSSFENLLDAATGDKPSFATSSPTDEHVKRDHTSSSQNCHNPSGSSVQSFSRSELQSRLKENYAAKNKELKFSGIRKEKHNLCNSSSQNLPESHKQLMLTLSSGLEKRLANNSTIPKRQLVVTGGKEGVPSTQSKNDSLNPGFSRMHVSTDNTKFIEKFVYTDTELNISFVECRFPSIDKSSSINASASAASGDTTVIYKWQQFRNDSSDVSGSSMYEAVCVSPSLEKLSNSQIRAKLISAGDSPGPVMDSTRELYLLRLARLQQKPLIHKVHDAKESPPQYCKELLNVVDGKLNIHIMKDLELKMNKAFEQPRYPQPWREGKVKNCFNYLLLDPRVTKDLPGRALTLPEVDRMKTFLAAIFYIGKGKLTRPYSHLYEAAQYVQKPQSKPSNKVQHILDIWTAGEGVVSLICFQNVIPVEAYTREACMVETIGLDNITNIRRGDYYGVVARWPREKRQRLGAYLLYRAYNILLNEGERQIKPADM